MPDRELPEKQLVDKGEQCGVAANAEGERQDSSRREPGFLRNNRRAKRTFWIKGIKLSPRKIAVQEDST